MSSPSGASASVSGAGKTQSGTQLLTEAGYQATTNVEGGSKRKLLFGDRDDHHLEERQGAKGLKPFQRSCYGPYDRMVMNKLIELTKVQIRGDKPFDMFLQPSILNGNC